MVQRDRLEEGADAAVDLRRGDARAQHRGGVVGPSRRRDHDTRDVAENGDRVVVVEVAAEALLVAVARDPHDHAVAVAALGEELQRRGLAAQLVLRVVEIGEVLDLGQRQEAADRAAEREAEDRRLVEQRVEDAAGAEARVQPARDAVDATLRSDVLAEEERLGMRLQRVAERLVDRERERQRLGRRLDGAAASRRTSSCTAAGERGASGRITSAAVSSCGRRAASSADLPHAFARVEVLLLRAVRPVRMPGADEPRGGREQGVAQQVGADVGRRPVGASRRRRPRGRGSGRCARWSTAGRRVSRTQSASSRATPSAGSGSSPAAASYRIAGRLESALSTQPDGEGTLIPRPLSSHTRSSGTGRRWWAACEAVLSAACAVAWFSDASPKLATAIASPGQALGTPSLRARSIAIATPTARGRCEAIVDVCGMIASSWWPKTLCRPPAIGSSDAAATPSITSGIAVASDLSRPRQVEGTRAVVEQGRVARPQRQRDDGVALVPGRADRVEGAALLLQPARREVAAAAADLRAPDRIGVRRRRPDHRRRELAERGQEVLLERIEIRGSPARRVRVAFSAEEGKGTNQVGVDRFLPHDRAARLHLAVHPLGERVGVLAGVGADDQVLPLADRAVALRLELLLEPRSRRAGSGR